MHGGRTGKIVTGGISAAIIIVCLYLGTLIRNNRIAFMIIATFIASIPYIRCEIKTGLTAYFASAILSLIIIPNKLYAGVYVFFGIYPLVKLLSERSGILAEFIYKYIWFNITLLVNYLTYKYIAGMKDIPMNFNVGGIHLDGPAYFVLLLMLFEVAFFVYDYFFTKFIMFFRDRISK